jgi:hypothetical protein
MRDRKICTAKGVFQKSFDVHKNGRGIKMIHPEKRRRIKLKLRLVKLLLPGLLRGYNAK